MGTSLDDIVSGAVEKFGSNSVMCLTDKKNRKVPAQSTGIPNLDLAIGVGGLPKGRIIEIYGPESCLDGETFIQYNIRDINGKIINHKGGSLCRLYERFKGVKIIKDRRGMKDNLDMTNVTFTASSVNDENRIIQNRIIDVVDVGDRQCYELKTISGLRIIATAEHRFLCGQEYIQLKDLKVDDIIKVHTNTPYVTQNPKKRRKEINFHIKFHPFAPTKIINGVYKYIRFPIHRAIVEASINNLTLEEYSERLNNKNIEGMKFLTSDDHVHHKDGDKTNNILSNLEIMSNSEHIKLHCKKNAIRDLSFIAVDDRILSITCVGNRRVFDIKMQSPFNNFIANKFVVHNSGKTTTVLTFIANAQKRYNSWAWFGDMEHALDPDWAENLGVNLDKLLISQPSYGEECLNIAEYMLKTGVIDIVVVDSVASLVPKAELEGEMGDSHMGLQARLMSQAMRKLTGICSRTEGIVIFTNQIREKIGIVWGSNENTSGGRALKFYASVRIDVRKTTTIGTKEDPKGTMIKFSIKKNKVAPPFKICEAALLYNRGFDFGINMLDAGVSTGIIIKSGHSYTWNKIALGKGKENAAEGLNKLTEEQKQELYEQVCGVKGIEDRLPVKDKIAKLQKKLIECTDEEEKKKLEERIKILTEALNEQLVNTEPEESIKGENTDD